MTYCQRCGSQMPDDATFCSRCGSRLVSEVSAGARRQTVWDGTLHKCPNCGQVLSTLAAKCPGCGYELRTSGKSESLAALTRALAAVDADAKTRKDERKAALVRNYVIPNNKGDIFEFLMLAESNMDFDVPVNANASHHRPVLDKAWRIKFDQAAQKAELFFADDPQLLQTIRDARASHQRKAAMLDVARSKIVLMHSIPLLIGLVLVAAALVDSAARQDGLKAGLVFVFPIGIVVLIAAAIVAGGKTCGIDELTLNSAANFGLMVVGVTGIVVRQGESAMLGLLLALASIIPLAVCGIQAIRFAMRK